MRDRLGVILATTERLDPLGRKEVLPRPLGSRDRVVGDVADDRVMEGVLRLRGDAAAAQSTHELFPLEAEQRRFDRHVVEPCDRGGSGGPERAPDHRSVPKRRLLVRLERVETAGDEPLHRLRQRQLAFAQPPAAPVTEEVAAVDEHPDELLRVERIAFCADEQCLLELCRDEPLLEQVAEEGAGLAVAQRRQRDRRGVCPGSPPRPALEHFRTRRAEEDDRHAGRPVGQMVEEVEQPFVRPVQVLEDEHQGDPIGPGLRRTRARR